MKHPEITHREELNGREISEIATILEGARKNNRIVVDRKVLREYLNHMLTNAGLIASPEDNNEVSIFEEEFSQFTSSTLLPRNKKGPSK